MPRLADLWVQCGPAPSTPQQKSRWKQVFAALGMDTGADIDAEMTLAEFRASVADLERTMAEAERLELSPHASAMALSITANVAKTRAQHRARRPQQVNAYNPDTLWAQIRGNAE